MQLNTIFSEEKAEEAARLLNADDEDDWTYVPRHDPKGSCRSLVEIYDQDGELVGRL